MQCHVEPNSPGYAAQCTAIDATSLSLGEPFWLWPRLLPWASLHASHADGCLLRLQLACARIGAVHSVVFAGFSAESLSGRMQDAQPRVLLTCSAVKRGPKAISLKVRGARLLTLLLPSQSMCCAVCGVHSPASVSKAQPSRPHKPEVPTATCCTSAQWC